MPQIPKIQWEKLVQIQYWVEGVIGGPNSPYITPTNDPEGFFFWFWLNLFSLIFSLGVLLRVTRAFLHDEHPLQSRLPTWANNAIWLGLVGLAWFLFRQTETAFLGARFWLLFMFIWASVVIFLVLRYLLKYYPLEIAYFRREILKQKPQK